MIAAIAWVGSIQVEIFEPRGGKDQIYRDFLPKDGFGINFFHFGALARTIEDYEARKNHLARLGYDIIFDYDDRPSIKAFYADLRPLLGHLVEYVWVESEDLLTLNGLIPRS